MARVKVPDWAFEAYAAGESMLSVSLRTGLARPTLLRHFRRRGLEIRTVSQANILRMQRMTAAERKALAAPANAACRGRRTPYESQVRRARTLEKSKVHASPNEKHLTRLLEESGASPTLQKACGKYNIDVALWPLAIEVMGGGWHGYGQHRQRSAERAAHLLSQGWAVVAVWCIEPYGGQTTARPNRQLVRALLDLRARVVSGEEGRPIHTIRADGRFYAASADDVGLLAAPLPARLRP